MDCVIANPTLPPNFSVLKNIVLKVKIRKVSVRQEVNRQLNYLPSPNNKKLIVTMAIYTMQTRSNQNPKALDVHKNICHAQL